MSARELITEHLDLWTGAVTKKSSSGRGSNGKVELTGVKKLRELILQLAVMGRLVEQDAADTSPNLQVDKIYRERTGLIAAGKIRLPSRRPTLSAPELKPFSIPDSWSWTKLEDLFAVVTDGDHQAPPKSEKGVPFLVIGNLNAGQVNFFGCKHVDEAYYEKLDWGRKPTSGDLLYTVTGSYGIPIKVATERGFCVQRHVAILRATDSTPGDFVKLLLASTFGKAYADSIATGIAQKTVPLTGLRKMPVPLPPVQEQHRIVQKVDELMALCDRLEQQTSDQLEAHETLVDTLLGTLTQSENATELADNWARLAAHFDTLFTTEQSIDKLKQTILQLAVMGRLVEQDAGDEPATKLVERIKADKALLIKNKEIKAQAKLKLIHQTDTSRQMPRHWVSATLDELSHVQGGIQKQPKRRPQEHKYPYLRVADVQRGFLMACSDLPEFELFNDELRQYHLKEGDILVVEGNGSAEEIGRCAIWDGRVPDCVYQNHLMRVRPIVTKTSDYIALYLNSPSGIDEMKRLAVTSSGLYNLSVGKIRSIPVPLPPLHEQIRIIQKVDELTALCDQLKERLNQASETRNQLAEAVVQGALN